MFALPPPDGSRDPRIEDPSNLWFVHLIARLLLPVAIRLGVRPNPVSFSGLAFGAAAAWCYWYWDDAVLASLGLVFCLAWLIADGLDGMIARATGAASALGRFLDGVCDHAVFILIYISLGLSIGTIEAVVLAVSAGFVHALQAMLYEGERARFHRRLKGDPGRVKAATQANALVRGYDRIASSMDRWAKPFDELLAQSADPKSLGQVYGKAAAPTLKSMWMLSNNMRVFLIYLACIADDPALFWWIELGPLSLIALIGIVRHRRAEQRLVEAHAMVAQSNASEVP